MASPTDIDMDERLRIDGLYRALMALRIHKDRMIWNRVQLLIALRGAVLGGSYAIGAHQLAALFLGAGALLSLVIYALVRRDQLDRDINNETLEALGELLLPGLIADRLNRAGRSTPYIRLRADAPAWIPLSTGRSLIRLVIVAFVLFDVALATLHILGRAPVLVSSY
jgi:hypothetical protein